MTFTDRDLQVIYISLHKACKAAPERYEKMSINRTARKILREMERRERLHDSEFGPLEAIRA